MKLNLEKGQKLWFTSDTHYNHTNICSATTKWTDPMTCREFKSLDQMNAVLVNNINAVVGKDDILIHLGDWSFGGFDKIEEFRNRIVCQNIHLVLGNHDHHITNNKGGITKIFSSVHQYLDLNIKWSDDSGKHDRAHFVCMHYPIASWDGLSQGVSHLHGHVHLPSNQRIGKGKSMDVGVDGNNLSPISMSDVLSIMEKQPISGLSLLQDHHIKL